MEVFAITGPSGSGKTHLIHEITSSGVYPLEVYTDRAQRPSEKASPDRVYLTNREFNSSLKEFLYWFEFQENRYGYKRKDIKRQQKLGKAISFNVVPSFLSNIVNKLPEVIVIYLFVDEEHFPMLFDRMLNRDLSGDENKHQKKFKVKKIEERLKYARRELKELKNIREVASQNPKSRIFNISGDDNIYKEVIPYIKELL